MPSFLNKLSDLAERADDLVMRTRSRLGLLHPLQLVTYRSYGTAGRLYVKPAEYVPPLRKQ
jgi:hypothetical protein